MLVHKKFGLCLTTEAESAWIWTLIGTHRLLSVLLHGLDLSCVVVCAEYLSKWQPWWANLGLISQRAGSSLGKMFLEWLKAESSPGEGKISGGFKVLRLDLCVPPFQEGGNVRTCCSESEMGISWEWNRKLGCPMSSLLK